jgi:hypothetical protein
VRGRWWAARARRSRGRGSRGLWETAAAAHGGGGRGGRPIDREGVAPGAAESSRCSGWGMLAAAAVGACRRCGLTLAVLCPCEAASVPAHPLLLPPTTRAHTPQPPPPSHAHALSLTLTHAHVRADASCSGGEKRRVTAGEMLVSNAQVFCLDAISNGAHTLWPPPTPTHPLRSHPLHEHHAQEPAHGQRESSVNTLAWQVLVLQEYQLLVAPAAISRSKSL